MSFLEKLADKYLDELFQSSNVSRANLQSQSSFSMRRDFDPYITPYSLSMEVRNTTTNIANIAQTPVVSNLIIGSFPIGIIKLLAPLNLTLILYSPHRTIASRTQITRG